MSEATKTEYCDQRAVGSSWQKRQQIGGRYTIIMVSAVRRISRDRGGGDAACVTAYMLNVGEENIQEAQQLIGWPTVLPHKLNPNPKPITN